jgi:hypothetical protein
MVWTFLASSKVFRACRSYVRYSYCPRSNFSSPQCLCLEAFLTVSIICGYLLFSSYNLQRRFLGISTVYVIRRTPTRRRRLIISCESLVFLSGVLEFCIHIGCDATSVSTYSSHFMIKNYNLILLDQNAFLNVSTLECETTASPGNVRNQIRTNWRLVTNQRRDKSKKKKSYSGNLK